MTARIYQFPIPIRQQGGGMFEHFVLGFVMPVLAAAILLWLFWRV